MRSDDLSAAPHKPPLKSRRAAQLGVALLLAMLATLGAALLYAHRGHHIFAAPAASCHKATSQHWCCGVASPGRRRQQSTLAASGGSWNRRIGGRHQRPYSLLASPNGIWNWRIRSRQRRAASDALAGAHMPATRAPENSVHRPPGLALPAPPLRRHSKQAIKGSPDQAVLAPPSATAATAHEQRAYLSFTVNGMDDGEVLAVIRRGDVLVPLADLKRAGLKNLLAEVVPVGGQPYASLRSLSPSVAYAFDDRNLSLKLVAQPQYFGATVINLSGTRPADITYSKNASAFFNYALDWQNFNQLSEFSELGISSHGNLYYTGFSAQPDGRIIRGQSFATFDNPARMKRWVVGDTFADGGELGGSSFLGGIGVSRNFGLNPYFVRYPGVGLSGQALTPSTAEIYVNGYLVGTQLLPPGKFDITNIPVVAGGGNTQVVIRDAFGRTQTLSSSYYYSTAVLQRGLSDYSYNLGARRLNSESSGGDYGPLVFVGRERIGLTDWFTAGGRLDAAPALISGGPSASFRLGSGQLGVNAALSRASGLGGAAAEVDYSYQNRHVSYGGSLAVLGPYYATASLAPTDNRATRLTDLFAGFALGPSASLTLDYTTSRLRDGGSRQQVSFAGAIRLSNKFDLVATADHFHAAPSYGANQFFMALNYQLGRNTLAAVSQQGGAGGGGSGLSVQQSLPLGSGYGYRFAHGTGSEIHAEDLFQYQSPFGLYQAAYRQVGGVGREDVLASGGVVDAGDGIMFTRAVEDGFAVIDLPNLRGVRGYFNNQPVGRTDAKGRLLIPNLLSYYGNKVEISDQDVPLDYGIQETEEIVAPPYRGGALVRFPVQRISAVTGTMIVDGARKVSVPAFGQLRVMVNGQPVVSELGRRGEFYLENVLPGRYPGEVEYADGLCAFFLVVPSGQAALTEVGRVRCTPQQISGATP